jgi:thiol-disulfide isomerase/thioredoxin
MQTSDRIRRSRLAGLAAGIVLGLCAVGAGAVETGQEAPKFANPDLKGNYVRFANVVGKKWVVVNFFATWCVPCKEEFPALEALQTEIGADKLQVVVFATDKEKVDVTDYFAQRPTNVTILLDPYQVTYLRYNSKDDGLPTSFLVGPDGKIEMKGVPSNVEFIKRMRLRMLESK